MLVELIKEKIFHITRKLNNSTMVLEKKIDLMDYKLYDLTYEEVLILNLGFKVVKFDYENYLIK